MNITRITCDLDDKSLLKLVKCLIVFWLFGFRKELSVNQSPSKRGFHISCWCKKDKGVTLERLIKIRRWAGDDKTRCDLDTWGLGQRMVNVLFTGKKRRTLKKGEVIMDKMSMQLETQGSETNVKISVGET